ncbi:hypothetical protein [Hansschlegelia sp.]|uniref:hypothetical protein n=1 Tax=Hansschlegelia sp. TaxID=2041892 RepID=UPI002C85CA49|nr:hypothetical protein [Hansschlegelia sp.]HVI28855.1 hypothetical protein [Hansschlegelia sp.]
MKTVRITESFTGYPAGKKRSFTAGEEVQVANDFAELIVGKGHAKEIEGSPAPTPKPGKPAADTKGDGA